MGDSVEVRAEKCKEESQHECLNARGDNCGSWVERGCIESGRL